MVRRHPSQPRPHQCHPPLSLSQPCCPLAPARCEAAAVRPQPCVLSAHRGVLLGRALGLDGSKLSWQAFDFAAGLIQRRNAGGRMCVMHVAATGEKAELVPESLK